MLNQVLASLPEDLQVLLSVRLVQGLSRGDLWSSAVHLQRTGRGDDHHGIWGKTADPTFDVAEFLHTHIGPETSLCKDIPSTGRVLAFLGPRELQGHAVGKDG